MPRLEGIKKVIISAPFGNYIQPHGCTPTVGTFTLDRRGGIWRRLWRAALTIRPVPGGWRNKMQLPNPGVYSIYEKYRRNYAFPVGKIISLHGLDIEQWRQLIQYVKAYGFAAVELNVSCPNVDQNEETAIKLAELIDKYFMPQGNLPFIVKLPPIKWLQVAKPFVDVGIKAFHACNTIWSPKGGISGKILKRYSLWAVEELRQVYSYVTIIGGGGVTSGDDAREYLKAGADHVSVGGFLFNPLNWHRPAMWDLTNG